MVVFKKESDDTMIDKDKFHMLNYIKKEEYVGSANGMRYMLKKKESENGIVLEATIWPEPFNYSKTPENKKQRNQFALDEEGFDSAVDWLNEQYEEQKELWDIVK